MAKELEFGLTFHFPDSLKNERVLRWVLRRGEVAE